MSSNRDEAETALELAVSSNVKNYLRRVLDEALAAIEARDPTRTTPVIALGTLLGWWTDLVADDVVREIEMSWDSAFSVNLSGQKIVSPRADAMAFHIAAVRDRLSRTALPEIPEKAFEQVRLSLNAGTLAGWGPDELARDIAERLSWEPDKRYWKSLKTFAEGEIDKILDPLGAPGTPARTYAHKNDPDVKIWQNIRAEAVSKIHEDESDWQVRATRIARTEATAAWNSGALAALEAEGRTHKEWLATNDHRTRHSHREADGQVVPLTQPFRVGQALLMMPGDPSGPPWETINCRCTVIGADAPNAGLLSAVATDFLTAAGGQGWRNQLRIPRGNGDRSGRWTFTPWKHLDDLAGLLNLLGRDSDPETRNGVREALGILDKYDPNAYDVHDQNFLDDVGRVADILNGLKPSDDSSLNEAIVQAAAGVTEFAESDWSLFDEVTDIDIVIGGRATNKNLWDGPIPSDDPVNPDLADWTSQALVDELLRIKNHPVQPSPTARRKRAAYLKELADRRDRDSKRDITLPEVTDFTKKQDTDLTRKTDIPNYGKDTKVDSQQVSDILDKWVQLRGSNTLDPREQKELTSAVVFDGEKAPTLYRGMNTGNSLFDYEIGRAVDFDAVSTSEDYDSAAPYSLNGFNQPVLFEIEGARGLRVADRAEAVAGYGEQEWITAGRFYIAETPMIDEEDGIIIVKLRPNLRGPGSRKPPLNLKRPQTAGDPGPQDILDKIDRLTDGRKDLLEDHKVLLESAKAHLRDAVTMDPDSQDYRDALGQAADRLKAAADSIGTDLDWSLQTSLERQIDNIRKISLPSKKRQAILNRDNNHGHLQDAFRDKIDLTNTPAGGADLTYQLGALRSELQQEIDDGILAKDSGLGIGGAAAIAEMRAAIASRDWMKFDSALTRLRAMALDDDIDSWKETTDVLRGLKPTWKDKLFGDDVISPNHAKIKTRLEEATTVDELREAFADMLDQSFGEQTRGYGPGIVGTHKLGDIMSAIRSEDDQRFLDSLNSFEARIGAVKKGTEGGGSHWADTYGELLAAKKFEWARMIRETIERDEEHVFEKFGTLPESKRTPKESINHVGMFYAVRTSNKNCVLATAAYELRRRGIDAYPKQTTEGRNHRDAYSSWFSTSFSEWHDVDGLKGRQGPMRYRIIHDAIVKTYPPNSRGAFSCGWKGTRHGHIWNWERDAKGDLTFYDAQTGRVIDPDSDYWRRIDWKFADFIRLDNKHVKKHVEVMLTPPDIKKDWADRDDLVNEAEILNDLRAQSRYWAHEWDRLRDLKRPPIGTVAYDDWYTAYQRAHSRYWSAQAALSDYRDGSNLVSWLKKYSAEVPYLDKGKNRL